MGRDRLAGIRWPVFVRDTASYTGGSFFGQASQVIYNILLRRVLAPSVMGLWDFVSVIQNFALSFDVGISAAAGIRLPVLKGAGETEEATHVRSTAFWAEFGQGVLMALGIVVYALAGGLRGGMVKAALVAAALIVLYALQDALTTFHQADQSFVGLARAMLLAAVLATILLPAGAWAAGINGLFLAAIVAWGARVALLYVQARRRKITIERRFRRDSFRGLIGLGLPLRLVEFPHAIFGLLDVFIVTRFLGLRALAIYSTARLIFLQASNLPALAGNVFVMRAFRLSGANVGRERLAADAKEFLLVEYLILHPVLIVSVLHGFALLAGQVIPQYSDGLNVLVLMMFAIYFVPQTTIIRNFWMLDRRLVALGMSNLVGLVMHAAGLAAVITIRGNSVSSVALGTLLGYGGYFLTIAATIGKELWGTRGAGGVAAHAFVGAAVTSLVVSLVPADVAAGPPLHAIAVTLKNLALSYALLVPLILYGLRRTAILRHFRTERPAETTEAGS